MIRFKIRPHRDGGRIVEIIGEKWMFDAVVSFRRRDVYGRREPFRASLVFYEADDT